MTLLEQIKRDMLEARRADDKTLKSLLSVLLGEIQLTESRGDDLVDAGIIKIIKKLKKSCDELYELGCASAKAESIILDRYIPETISIEEIECIIIASPLYEEIIKSDNPMKLTSRASALIAETGMDFNGKDISTVMKGFKDA